MSTVQPTYKDVGCSSLHLGYLWCIDRSVDRYAYQRGLWVIKQTGDTVTLANDLSFQPRSW